MRDGTLIRRLGSLLDIQNGYAFDSKKFGEQGLPLIRIRDLRNGYTTETKFSGEYDQRYVVRSGDFLIGMDGEFACYEWKGRDALLNQRVCKLYRFSKETYPRFLFLGINRYLKEIEDATSYTTVKHISSRQILDVEMPIPPLKEQERTVAILDEAFRGIATAQANAEMALSRVYAAFEAHREGIFSQKVGWEKTQLSEICEIKHGFAFQGEFFTSEGNDVLLTPGNFFERGGYRDRSEKQKFYKGPIPDGFVLSKNDLLVAMTEQAAGLLGSSMLVPESGRFLHNQRLGLVMAKPSIHWENSFFFHFFNTRAVRGAIHASASGTKVRHTSPTKIGQVVAVFPKSQKEQLALARKLAKHYAETERLEELYERKLRALDALKQSLLHRAFSGSL